MNKRFRLLLSSTLALALAACTSSPAPPPAGYTNEASGDGFAIHVKPPELATGETGVLAVWIAVGDGHEWNAGYPMHELRAVSSTDKTVRVPKTPLAPGSDGYREDEHHAEWKVPLEARSAGRAQVDLAFRFRLCSGDGCVWREAKAEVPIVVR